MIEVIYRANKRFTEEYILMRLKDNNEKVFITWYMSYQCN